MPSYGYPPRLCARQQVIPTTMVTMIPHKHDVLLGRGGASNNHEGNRIYRAVVEALKPKYTTAARYDKMTYAEAIVGTIRFRSPQGRFLERDGDDGRWYEVSKSRAVDKTVQALREKRRRYSNAFPLQDLPDEFCRLLVAADLGRGIHANDSEEQVWGQRFFVTPSPPPPPSET